MITCRICRRDWEVSEEDPDATMGEALLHVVRRHQVKDDDAIYQLKLVAP